MSNKLQPTNQDQEEPTLPVENMPVVPVKTEEWDSEAELQARMWNAFVRNARKSSDTEDTDSTVTPQEIMRSIYGD